MINTHGITETLRLLGLVDGRIEQGSTITVNIKVGLNEERKTLLTYCIDASDPLGYWAQMAQVAP